MTLDIGLLFAPFDGIDGDIATAMRDFPQNATNLPHQRVLVVDDEPLACWSVGETLAESGYEVVVATDGASAIRAFSRAAERPDVVLLDVWLQDSNDLGLLSTLRQLSPLTPIVVVTAYGSPELRDEAHRLGAVGVVDKPVDMSALAPLVACALGRRPH